MKLLRSLLDSQGKHFHQGGRLEFAYPVYEMVDTFLYTPGAVTKGASHVRDGLDLKRMMITVVIALMPAVFMAMYNTGYQAHLSISQGAPPLITWQTDLAVALGLGAWDPNDLWACLTHGALYYLPVLIVTFAAGGACEVLFALVRKHDINEGLLVTGMLFPLILPPTIPLWQVALGIVFGVVIGKEIFGGTGMNILNPALTARAFLFFAYPAQISGDKVWTAADTAVDGASRRDVARRSSGHGAERADRRCELVGRVRGVGARLDGRDFGARLLDRRGDSNRVARGLVAHHARRVRRVGDVVVAAERDRLRDQPAFRRAVLVAHRAGGLGLRRRLHGDRPGVGLAFEYRQVLLRVLDRAVGDLDSGGQPGVSGGDDAGHPVHEPVRRLD